MAKDAVLKKIYELIEPVINALGYVLWGCELHAYGKHKLLRVYIDLDPKLMAAMCGAADDGIEITNIPRGIGLNDCSRVSNEISAVLDVEEPIIGGYDLEVSSPGINRPLFTPEQFKQYVGKQVQIRLGFPQDGRRNYVGYIVEVLTDKQQADREEYIVKIVVDGEHFTIPFESIEKANLVTKD
jgi:ribosome maturation factor RimP